MAWPSVSDSCLTALLRDGLYRYLATIEYIKIECDAIGYSRVLNNVSCLGDVEFIVQKEESAMTFKEKMVCLYDNSINYTSNN